MAIIRMEDCAFAARAWRSTLNRVTYLMMMVRVVGQDLEEMWTCIRCKIKNSNAPRGEKKSVRRAQV